MGRVALVALVAGIAAGSLDSTGAGSAARCARLKPCSLERLPASITIETGRGDYQISPLGRLRRIRLVPSPYPRRAIWFPGTATWYRIERGHLVVGRRRTLVWRSREQIAANRVGVIAAGPTAVAFQHRHRLYVAALSGRERPVARREVPLGWTAGGLYTYSYVRRDLLLRSDTGALLQTVGRPREYVFDLADRTLYFLEGKVLMGARGTRKWRLASLNSLGVSADSWLQPLGGLVEVLDDRRLAVVRPDGSLLAAVGVRHLRRIFDVVPAPDRKAVAFVGQAASARGSSAATVYLVSRGARAAVSVHRQPGFLGGCAQWAGVEWHGTWLLYSDTDGHLVAIDTAGARPVIDLSARMARVLGAKDSFSAYWTP